MNYIDICFDTSDKLIGILLNILNTLRWLLPHILSNENPSLKIDQHVSIIENEYENYINSFQKEDHTKTDECCNEGDYTELDEVLRKKSKTTSDEQDKARFKQIVHNILRRVLNIVNNNPKTKYQDKSWYICSYIIKCMLLLKAFFTLKYTECIEECKGKIDENSTIFKMTKDYMMLECMRAPNDTKDKGGSQYKSMVIKKLLGNSYVNMNNQSIIGDINKLKQNECSQIDTNDSEQNRSIEKEAIKKTKSNANFKQKNKGKNKLDLILNNDTLYNFLLHNNNLYLMIIDKAIEDFTQQAKVLYSQIDIANDSNLAEINSNQSENNRLNCLAE